MFELVRAFISQTGLRASLRVEMVPRPDESFARLSKQTNDIRTDTIILKKIREGTNWIYEQCSYITPGLNEPLTDIEACNLITIDKMAQAVYHLDKASDSIAWYGDPDNLVDSDNKYKECAGICIYGANVIEYNNLTDIFELLSSETKHTKIMWGCFSPCRLLRDLYILPLSIKHNDGGVYEQRVDYSHASHKNATDDTFWTDEGEFLWRVYRDRFDLRLTCQTEFRIVVPKPELVTVIKDVPVIYMPREEV